MEASGYMCCYFPVNFAKFLRTSFLQNTFRMTISEQNNTVKFNISLVLTT